MSNHCESTDSINVKSIQYLYELRHACNVLDIDTVAKALKMSVDQVILLYDSCVHGSEELKQFLRLPSKQLVKAVEQCELISREQQQRKQETREKNEQLISELKRRRKQFAGIGTNKAKRRLNKMSTKDPVAKAVRTALEIEDKSISAKNSYGPYPKKIYDQKTNLILDLCNLFKQQKWTYGVQQSNVPPTTHVIYFEIPDCEQISWHFTSPENMTNDLPIYESIWDQKINSTLDKLEATTLKLLETE